jgi:hypothetical protein
MGVVIALSVVVVEWTVPVTIINVCWEDVELGQVLIPEVYPPKLARK